MGGLLRRVACLGLAVLPSGLKIALLRTTGHTIGKGCRIGCTYLDVARLEMGDHCHIAHFNYIKGLQRLRMDDHARIGGRFNWVTASSRHRGWADNGYGELSIGYGSNITGRHYIDVQRGVSIGEKTLMAGHGSTIWTHSVDEIEAGDERGVRIGDNCYVGSHCIFVQGAAIGDRVIVGAGSVISRDLSSESQCLIAGNPAATRKRYPDDHPFWTQTQASFLPKADS